MALDTTLALSAAFSTPAMASGNGADCTAADKAKITISKESGVRIVDITKSSTACLEKYANGVSRTELLLVADGDFQAWRDINTEAARQLNQEEKKPTYFLLVKQMAITRLL